MSSSPCAARLRTAARRGSGVNAIEGARRVLERVMAVDVGGKQASRPRPGHADAHRGALMAGGDPHRAGRGAAGLRPAPPPGRRSAGGLCRDRGGGRYRRAVAGQDRVRPLHVSGRDRARRRASCAPSRRAAVAWACRRRPPFYSHGALDAGFFCFKGAESGMWGPGAIEQWHSEDERIAVIRSGRAARVSYARHDRGLSFANERARERPLHRLRDDGEAVARCPTRWRSAKTSFACTRAIR